MGHVGWVTWGGLIYRLTSCSAMMELKNLTERKLNFLPFISRTTVAVIERQVALRMATVSIRQTSQVQ